MKIYEATIPLVTDDRAYNHKFAESLMKVRGEKTERDYLWSQDKMTLRIRTPNPSEHLVWNEVAVPKNGEMVAGTLLADVSRTPRRGEKRVRVPVIGIQNNLIWFCRQMQNAGLELHEERYEEAKALMVFKEKLVRHYHLAKFEFVATVQDEEKLSKSMIFGIGNAKAYGFGMLNVKNAHQVQRKLCA